MQESVLRKNIFSKPCSITGDQGSKRGRFKHKAAAVQLRLLMQRFILDITFKLNKFEIMQNEKIFFGKADFQKHISSCKHAVVKDIFGPGRPAGSQT